MTLKIQKTCLKWLQKHQKKTTNNNTCVKTTRVLARAGVAKSAASENNTCTCTCRICNLISAEKGTFQREKKNVLLCYKSNGQCLVWVHPIRDALGQLGEHPGSQRCSRLHLEHLLHYLCALPFIRVHPELDGRMLDIVHSLNTCICRGYSACSWVCGKLSIFCYP